LFLLIYPPTRAQWGARAGGLWGGFPNPAKLICMGFAKNGLASSQPHRRAPRTRRGAGSRAERRRSRGSQQVPSIPLPAPAAALPAPFSYTHRPGRSGPHGPAGSGVDFPIPQNSFVWVPLKMGSRARDHAERPRAPPRPCPAARHPEQALQGLPGAARERPGQRTLYPKTPTLHPDGPTLHPPGSAPCTPRRLPYTPTGLPYTPRAAHPVPQDAYPTPRRAYPTPPSQRTLYPDPPTLHLPASVPYTSPLKARILLANLLEGLLTYTGVYILYGTL
jgi:hypothetical protein